MMTCADPELAVRGRGPPPVPSRIRRVRACASPGRVQSTPDSVVATAMKSRRVSSRDRNRIIGCRIGASILHDPRLQRRKKRAAAPARRAPADNGQGRHFLVIDLRLVPVTVHLGVPHPDEQRELATPRSCSSAAADCAASDGCDAFHPNRPSTVRPVSVALDRRTNAAARLPQTATRARAR